MSKLDGDVYVAGTLRADKFIPPFDSVGDENVDVSRPINGNKLGQKYNRLVTQPYGVVAVSERRVIHAAYTGVVNGGVVEYFDAGLVVPCLGAATITIRLLKNGVNILSSTMTIDNTLAAYQTIPGTFASTVFTADDVFEVEITATAGGGTLGQGLFVNMVLREPPT
jgi:hypothetical protein